MKGTTMFFRLLRPLNAAAVAALSIAAIAAPTVLSAGSPNEQFIPLATFRVGSLRIERHSALGRHH
jgi:hypothetical protein